MLCLDLDQSCEATANTILVLHCSLHHYTLTCTLYQLIIMMIDADFYPQWDNCTLNYELTKYNFPTLVLDVVKEVFPQVDSL